MIILAALQNDDDNEGPVTKSIRLTSSLILRNLVIYSTNGRRFLRSYEPHLASVALSNVESSRTIAQVLYDMNQQMSSQRGVQQSEHAQHREEERLLTLQGWVVKSQPVPETKGAVLFCHWSTDQIHAVTGPE
uniref:Uncharacterized protein n=1 Tax=Timema poppense TaxID=170557 RepID=A0A7R9H1Q6_TIMPO|nr:unnamed protein product [Timema poppensis]